MVKTKDLQTELSEMTLKKGYVIPQERIDYKINQAIKNTAFFIGYCFAVGCLLPFDVYNKLKPKVSVRQFEVYDINGDYIRWLNDSKVTKYLNTVPKPYTEQMAHEYLCHVDGLFFAIIRRGKLIGTYHLSSIKDGEAWCGILIGREYWGHGYATEAHLAVISKVVTVNTFHAGVEFDNMASRVSFEKAGFELNGKNNKGVLYRKQRLMNRWGLD